MIQGWNPRHRTLIDLEQSIYHSSDVRRIVTQSRLDRKLLEAAVSFRIEAAYPGDEGKQQILQHYLNRIFLGHNIRGLEEASRTYFEKSAKDLSLSESALLAGIVRGLHH